MSTPHYSRVREFMKKKGREVHNLPVIPTERTRLMCAVEIMRVAIATVEALGIRIATPMGGGISKPITMNGDQAILFSPLEEGHIHVAGVAQGCVDTSRAAMQVFASFGMDDELLLQEVDEAMLMGLESNNKERHSPPRVVHILQKQDRIR